MQENDLASDDQRLVNERSTLTQPNGRAMILRVFCVVVLIFSIPIAYFAGYSKAYSLERINDLLELNNAKRNFPLISKIAFGSCTSKGVHDDEAQTIWTDGVIASQPDAWIWLGDFAYLDYPSVNCQILTDSPQCNCNSEKNAFTVEPFCLSGDEQHSLFKYQTMLQNPEYKQFLDYMCRNVTALGLIPPPGTDPNICQRPIIGTWDDHDYGWDNGNKLHPKKQVFKQLFLDAIGENRNSIRRNSHRGMWYVHRLNEGFLNKEIDIFLLDERYNRSPLPCHVRRKFCLEDVLGNKTQSLQYKTEWCKDFLYGGLDGKGTCCNYDEEIQLGWCKIEENKNNELFEEACDINSEKFGLKSLILDSYTNTLRKPNGSEPIDIFQDSPFCEVLGREQRIWLKNALKNSNAKIKIIASSSVLLGSDGIERTVGNNTVPIQCSSDDWDCYNIAQKSILSDINRANSLEKEGKRDLGEKTCIFVITGDFHWGDIKKLVPGKNPKHSDWLGSENFTQPIFQVMSSGMTNSTAIPNRKCESYLKDPAQLRDHEECDIVLEPNFGFIEVSWKENDMPGFNYILLKIRNSKGEVKLKSMLTPDMCA